jgi:hypothetical protein
MPQVAENFDAGGRAVAYQQAVAKISTAESAYFRARAGRSPVVPNNVLTVEVRSFMKLSMAQRMPSNCFKPAFFPVSSK